MMGPVERWYEGETCCKTDVGLWSLKWGIDFLEKTQKL